MKVYYECQQHSYEQTNNRDYERCYCDYVTTQHEFCVVTNIPVRVSVALVQSYGKSGAKSPTT